MTPGTAAAGEEPPSPLRRPLSPFAFSPLFSPRPSSASPLPPGAALSLLAIVWRKPLEPANLYLPRLFSSLRPSPPLFSLPFHRPSLALLEPAKAARGVCLSPVKS
ncbi:hypothetical protein AABB24_028166 [Solanum stoloniferum]|uniref:Uncharacterized protein n=1 Tax=Solanum stoloniferum TaxID=62892 RepID=A0ABD2S723_9SOLN